MLDKDPTSYSLITYGWVFILSIWSGLVSFHTKAKLKHHLSKKLITILGDVATSLLAGLLTFYMCELAEFEPLKSAVMICITAHMGPRLFFLLNYYGELKLRQVLEKLFLIKPKN